MNEIVSPLQSISYTNKDFVDIYTELLDLTKQLTSKWDPSISNESDPGVILLKLNAIIADKCNYSIDKNILECFPLSVTQQSNARQLFEQLGYYMHWYRSAVTNVSIKYTGESIDSVVNIDPFTIVSDSDNNVIYTLVGPSDGTINDTFNIISSQLSLKGDSSISLKAIQGLPVGYEINGSTVVTVADLDDNNRIYFNTTQIAENGIFITNTKGDKNYNSWIKKDNLLVENLGNTYYKFGVSNDGKYCYLEFPQDAPEIFNEGIKITYIQTDGTYGDISRNYLSKFYNDLTVQYEDKETNESKSLTLGVDNVSLYNTSISVGSSENESINDAYRNYKKVVGTFDTLVTLRDYINYINNSRLVSNCIVCDRNNDIQCSYDCITSSNDIDSIVTYHQQGVESMKDTSDNDVDVKVDIMNAFSLKMYLLSYVNDESFKSNNTSPNDSYNFSFYPLTNLQETIVKKYLEDSKSLNHNFSDILETNEIDPNICFFKNKYAISCTIIPQSTLTTTQKNEVRKNIEQELRLNLNSKKLEFGEEVSYDLVHELILRSDERIKYVNLENIEYKTYAVYYEELVFTYDDTDKCWYDNNYNKVNIGLYGLSVSDPEDGATVSTYVFNEVDINGEPIEYYTDMQFDDGQYKLVYPNSISIDSDKLYSLLESAHQTLYQDIEFSYNGSTWSVTNESLQLIDFSSCYEIKQLTYSTGVSYSIGDRFNDGSSNFYTVIKDISKSQNQSLEGILNLGLVKQSNFSTGNRFKFKLSKSFQFSTDIYAKSCLAGKTQLFVENNQFDYEIRNYCIDLISNIQKIEPNVDIIFESNESSIVSSYKIRSNEVLQFYHPNLIDFNNYSNYVKYEYSINQDVLANTNYELKANEYIAFYFKDNTEDSDELYNYHIYGSGTVIYSSFNLLSNSGTNNVATTYDLVKTKDGKTLDSSTTLNGAMSRACSAQISAQVTTYLTGKSNISIKKINEIKIDSNTNYLVYWITNNIQENKYFLFDSDESTEKILEVGEYFFYSNPERTQYQILGAGTTINRESSGTNLSVPKMDDFSSLLNGTVTMSDFFTTIDSDLNLVENQFTNLSSGYIVQFTPVENNEKLASIRITTDNCSFTKSDFNIETYFEKVGSVQNYQQVFTCSAGTDQWKIGDTGVNLVDYGFPSVAITDPLNGASISVSDLSYLYSIKFDKDEYEITNLGDDRNNDRYSYSEDQQPTLNLSDFKIEYKTPDLTDSDKFLEITPLDANSENSLKGRSRLILNIGPGVQQILLDRQSIGYYVLNSTDVKTIEGKNNCLLSEVEQIFEYSDFDSNHNKLYLPYIDANLASNTAIVKKYSGGSWSTLSSGYSFSVSDSNHLFTLTNALTDGEKISISIQSSSIPDKSSNPMCYPVVIQSSLYISNSGMKEIDTSFMNEYGVYEYLSIYQYCQLLESPQDKSQPTQISYNDSISNIYFRPSEGSRSIPLSLPAGNYIIELDNNIPGLNSLTCTYQDTNSISASGCTTIQGITQFKNTGIYYICIKSENRNIRGILTLAADGINQQLIIKFGNCYAYSRGDDLSEDRFNQIVDRLQYLDNKNLYKYNYKVDVEKEIKNPLVPKSFLNANHIYNDFTICQIQTPIEIK